MLNSSFARKISSVSIAAMIFVSACGERDSSSQAGTAHSPSASERSVAQRPLALHVQSAVVAKDIDGVKVIDGAENADVRHRTRHTGRD